MRLFPANYSLRIRLIASVVLIEVVMLSLLVWSNLAVIHQAHADRLQDTAHSLLQQVATTTGRYLMEVDYASLEQYLQQLLSNQELAYLTILDRDGKSVFSFGRTPANMPPKLDTHPAVAADGIFDVSAGISLANRPMGQVVMGFSLQQMNRAVRDARLRSLAIAGSEILLTILVTVIIGIRLTRRLGMLASAAERVGGGDYSVVVPVVERDEVGLTAEAFNRMVRERKQAAHEHQLLLQGNRFLSHQLLEVQEAERRHLSRELHDELGQSMTAIQADAELISALARDKEPKIETSARAILNVSAGMYATVHAMMQRLRPGGLDELGLVAAIQEEIKQWQTRHPEVVVSFIANVDTLALNEKASINLFRIVQEALTNIAKHATASRVIIRLKLVPADQQDAVLHLSIEDDGKGMNLADPRQGLGLLGMRERMESLDGKLVIHSRPNKGLKIEASLLVSGAMA